MINIDKNTRFRYNGIGYQKDVIEDVSARTASDSWRGLDLSKDSADGLEVWYYLKDGQKLQVIVKQIH